MMVLNERTNVYFRNWGSAKAVECVWGGSWRVGRILADGDVKEGQD